MVELRLAHELPDTEAEGPGRRYAMWVQGCTLHCPGCCNPEMFAHGRGGTVVDATHLAQRIVSTTGIEGLSVLGGEPFEQALGVATVARLVRAAGLSVMVYSGFTLAELEARRTLPGVDALLGETDLLVDGRFEQDRPETKRRWVGSRNQVLHFLTPRYAPDDPRLCTQNTVELRLQGGQLTVNGWPDAADALRASRRRS